MIRRKLIILVVALVAALGLKAQPNTLYFMEDVALRHHLNPSFMPSASWFFEIPIFPSFYGEVGNNILSMRDFRVKKNGVWSTVYAPMESPDKYYKRMANINNFDARFAWYILNGGFSFNENNYMTLDLSLKGDAYVFLPKDMFGGIMYGAENNRRYNLSNFAVESYVYGELAVGYMRKVSDQWTIGLKLKGLIGFAGIHSDIAKAEIQTPTGNKWKLSAAGDIYAMTPYVKTVGGNTTFGEFRDLIKPQGIGGAVDLGATFRPTENLTISAAITDLGFINWNKRENISRVSVNGDYFFDEPTYKFNPDDPDPLATMINEISDNIGKSVNFQKTQGINKSINQFITTTANFGIEYGILDNMVSFAGLSNTRINFGNKVMQEFTLGVNFRPTDWLKTYFSHTLLNDRCNTIGLGVSVQAGPVNFYLAGDYIPFTTIQLKNASFVNNKEFEDDVKNIPVPYHNSRFNIQTGLVYYFDKSSGDKDRDGVRNNRDRCPDTDIKMLMAKCPDKKRTEFVDENGCTLDEDHDGVADCYDKCPNTPSGVTVDENGCPIDTDGDGVADYMDKCPDTPKGVEVDADGCPIDSDGDGVPDYLDKCPNTPRGVSVDVDGCPIDSDGDGVTDDKDKCPDTPNGISVDENGCPQDSDGDGVPDYKDKCPNTPKEVRGLVDENGCPKDTDGDGIPDYKDECPTIKGVKENKGCPAVKKDVLKVFKQALHGIQFDTGKSTIKSVSYGVLNMVVDIMKNNPDYNLVIAGHTDSQGNDDFNMTLSDKRAAAVRQYLIDKGVDDSRLQSIGYGETKPVATNKTAKGRAQNRRVEFTVVFEKLVKEED